MKWPVAACLFSNSSSLLLPISWLAGRGGGDMRMWDMYVEYADIAGADEPLGRIKARLAALSAFAESQGLTGQAAFDGLRHLSADLHGESTDWETTLYHLICRYIDLLMDTRRFSLLYRFVFFMCRERGQKSVSVSTAVDAWRLSLTGRFRLLDQWCAFVQMHQRHSISEDTWHQVLEFSRSVHEDLSNYDPEGAWPVLVDEFVDKMYSSESTILGDIGADLSSKLSSDDDREASAPASKATTLPGMAASAGSKRRRRDPKDDAAQVESVNSIAQLFAEMPSPLSCKRVRSSGCLVDVQDPMDESFDTGRIWERRNFSDSADDEMLAGSMHCSPVGSNQIGSREAMSPRNLSPPYPQWSRFMEKRLGPYPDVTLCPGLVSYPDMAVCPDPVPPDPILVPPSPAHRFDSCH